MADKPFKTIDEQISILESRGVETDEDTWSVLAREGYYSVVNGYKGPFLDKEAMRSSATDVYRPGTRFADIYALFLFDRALRDALFPYLRIAESTMRTAVVYAFCHAHGGGNEYLDRNNYTDARGMLFPKAFRGDRRAEHNKRLNKLMAILNTKVSNGDNKHVSAYVRHYRNKHDAIPLWVLSKDLTFGNMAHFYQLQQRNVQNEACKVIGAAVGLSDKKIHPIGLLRAFTVLTGFRNICAHGGRLYCATVNGTTVGGMVEMLLDYLDARDKKASAEAFGDALARYGFTSVPPAPLQAAIDGMGIPIQFDVQGIVDTMQEMLDNGALCVQTLQDGSFEQAFSEKVEERSLIQ